MEKTALISGGSKGIGRAIALKLAQAGINIAVVYATDDEAMQETMEMLKAQGANAGSYKCDVSDYAQTKNVVEKVVADFGSIDILVNNAGIVKDSLLISMKEEDFDRVVDVNLKGAFNLIKHASTGMIRRRWGRIINISSIVGLSGNAGQVNYSAAKAGLIGMTKSVARELALRNITCNAVAPGFIDTDMTQKLSADRKAELLTKIPLGRMGNAREVAELVAFLASDSSAYITGEVIRVDGGMGM